MGVAAGLVELASDALAAHAAAVKAIHKPACELLYFLCQDARATLRESR